MHLILGLLVIALNLAAGVLGAWRWYRVEPSPAFWVLARTGQAALVAQVLLGGLLVALDHEPGDDLHFLYGLLPLAVAFIAEQFRVSAAEGVLDERGLDSAQDVGRLPEAEQRSVVLAIVRREMGVVGLAAIVVALLALRAAFTSGGLG